MNGILGRAVETLRAGRMVILVDDEERENEGDLVLAAEHVTADGVNFMVTHARGLVCLALEAGRIDELELPLMPSRNPSPRKTAFTVSIEAREGVTTGISAADRARTIRVASDPARGARDLVTPGHVFPLRAVEGGTLVRAGHTEGSLDLMRVAGLRPAAVICEIMREDGTMARLPDLTEFALRHAMPIVAIKDLIGWRVQRECLVDEVAVSRLPCSIGAGVEAEFELHAFRSRLDGTEHLALVKRPPGGELASPALVRVHSECLTGDALGSLRCDCGEQLRSSLARIEREGSGVLVYMRRHEGRGIGLANKIRAYELQDKGADTVEANRHLGFGPDLRHYGMGAQILKSLGVREMRLLTNNPRKVVGLEAYGLSLVERVPITVAPNPHNRLYLATKRDKLGHELGEGGRAK